MDLKWEKKINEEYLNSDDEENEKINLMSHQLLSEIKRKKKEDEMGLIFSDICESKH